MVVVVAVAPERVEKDKLWSEPAQADTEFTWITAVKAGFNCVRVSVYREWSVDLVVLTCRWNVRAASHRQILQERTPPARNCSNNHNVNAVRNNPLQHCNLSLCISP